MKKCPVCKEALLNDVILEDGLPACRCTRCEGIWISSNPYLGWLRSHGPALPQKDPAGPDSPTWDTRELKLCADCGHIMGHYRVLPGARFELDHCANCNGVWFDKGEWEVVVAHNLHDKVNSFFTEPWQNRVKEGEARAILDKLYLDKFGAEDYARLKEIDAWLRNHPHRAMLLAFLQSRDPYKA